MNGGGDDDDDVMLNAGDDDNDVVSPKASCLFPCAALQDIRTSAKPRDAWQIERNMFVEEISNGSYITLEDWD